MRSLRAFRLKLKRRFKERLRWYKRSMFLFLFSLCCAVWSLFQWNAEGPLTALSGMFLPLVAWVLVASRLLVPRRDYWYLLFECALISIPAGLLSTIFGEIPLLAGVGGVIGPEYPRLLLLFRTAVVLYVVMPALYAGGVAHYEGSYLPEGIYRR